MKNRLTASLSILLVVAAAAMLTAGYVRSVSAEQNAVETADDWRAVLEANEKFYVALNAMFRGDPEPFVDVWWHTDDIVYMGADGAYNVGWERVYANWQKQAALKIGGEVRAADVKVTVGEDFAVTNQYTVGVNEFDGQSKSIRLRATSVFQKKSGRWRMICHHVDVIPVLDDKMKD